MEGHSPACPTCFIWESIPFEKWDMPEDVPPLAGLAHGWSPRFCEISASDPVIASPFPTLVCFALFIVPAAAGPVLTADSVADLARAQNPELQAARGFIAEAQARTRATGRMSNPELETELAGGQGFEGRVSVGVTQRFPLTARLRLERDLAGIEVEMARLEVEERERQIAVSARSAFYELAAIRSARVLARRQTKLADTFAKTIRDGVTQGFGSGFDADQAALLAETLRLAEESLRTEEIVAAAELNGLLGRQADAVLAVNELPGLPGAIPGSRPPGRRADLLLAEMALKAGATDVSLARANRWEDVGVGLFVEGERFRDEPDGIEPEALVGIQFNVPLPLWQNGAGRVAEKEARQSRRSLQLEALRFALRNEVLGARQVLSVRHRAAVQLQNELVPAAGKQVTEAEAAYGRGELEVGAVFRAVERLAEIELSALEARKKYFLAYAVWLGAMGEPNRKP